MNVCVGGGVGGGGDLFLVKLLNPNPGENHRSYPQRTATIVQGVTELFPFPGYIENNCKRFA